MNFAQSFVDSLTDAERAYFIATTDIFHDSAYSVIGRPSLSNQLQNTVVINLERSLSISNFPLLDQTSNWDCNIVSLPFLTTQNVLTTVDTGYTIVPATPTTAIQGWGGVTAFGVNTGGTTIIGASQYQSLNANLFFYPEYTGSLSDDIPRPFYEVLSMGMEVINSTPELYKGGNVVRYRVPTQGRKAELMVGDPTTQTSAPRTSFYCYPMPPITEAFATQYPDSVIDKAANGSYQMHALQDQVSDYYLAGNGRVFFSNPAPAASGPSSFNTWTSASAFDNTQSIDPPLIRGDFDMIGSYFTGLSPQTTLKIRSRAIVSLVPSSTNASLTSLAKISPDANPALDVLIGNIQSTFSPGIASSMNASGDWWRVILRGVAKIAKPIGKGLGGDTGEAIGGGIAAASDAIAKIGEKKKKTNRSVPVAKPKVKPPPRKKGGAPMSTPNS